jgi:hypothetical protein
VMKKPVTLVDLESSSMENLLWQARAVIHEVSGPVPYTDQKHCRAPDTTPQLIQALKEAKLKLGPSGVVSPRRSMLLVLELDDIRAWLKEHPLTLRPEHLNAWQGLLKKQSNHVVRPHEGRLLLVARWLTCVWHPHDLGSPHSTRWCGWCVCWATIPKTWRRSWRCSPTTRRMSGA